MEEKSREEKFEIVRIKGIQHWHETEARQVMSIWKEWNCSLIEFSRWTGISYKRLTNWKQKLSKRIEPGSEFIEVKLDRIEKSRVSDQTMEIVLRSDRMIRIQPGYDRESVKDLVELLDVIS